MDESAKENEVKHQCVWRDHETGELMVPKLFAESKQRDSWRKTTSDRQFQTICLIFVQALLIGGGLLKWSGDIHKDLLLLQGNQMKMGMQLEEHSKIIDRYVSALIDFQAQSRKDEASQREISDRMYRQK